MVQSAPDHVTQILNGTDVTGPSTPERLLPHVYEALRALAQKQMAAEPVTSTLQPTALVHEAYLRLVGDTQVQWENRGHFYAAAAIAMRRVLIERARRHHSLKRGGGRQRLPLEEAEISFVAHASQLLALDEALKLLQARDKRKSDIVNLRFFAGLTNEETAKALGVSLTTVKDDWKFAKAWLQSVLVDDV